MFVVAGLAFVVLLVVLFVGILQLRKRSKKKKIASNEALERLNQPVFSSNINGYEDGPPPGLLPPPAANMTHNQLYSVSSLSLAWGQGPTAHCKHVSQPALQCKFLVSGVGARSHRPPQT